MYICSLPHLSCNTYLYCASYVFKHRLRSLAAAPALVRDRRTTRDTGDRVRVRAPAMNAASGTFSLLYIVYEAPCTSIITVLDLYSSLQYSILHTSIK